MTLTKSDIPDLLVPGRKAEFASAYRTELDHSIADRIATVINTTQPSQKYAWLGTVPPMSEFVDERKPSGMAAYSVTIEDKVFEQFVTNATDEMSKDGVNGTPGVFIDGEMQPDPGTAVNAVLTAIQ